MGNIYFEQQNYDQAIKMYRMALDQIPSTSKSIRYFSYYLKFSSLKILANIGIACIKLSKFQDAVSSFESIMEDGPCFFAGRLIIFIA